LIDWCS